MLPRSEIFVNIRHIPSEDGFSHYQACTNYGPRKCFLLPARAFLVVENVAKARPRVNTCRRSTISSILHRSEIDFCGPRQIYVDNLALRDFWVVQACHYANIEEAILPFFLMNVLTLLNNIHVLTFFYLGPGDYVQPANCCVTAYVALGQNVWRLLVWSRDERTVKHCDPDPVLIFYISVQVQPQSKNFVNETSKCKWSPKNSKMQLLHN